MTRKKLYELVYAKGITKHLESIDSKYDSLIRDRIKEQLEFEPSEETRNRKPLRQPAPFAAHWEIRFGPQNRFRVLYDIDEEKHAVQILAVGEKSGNRLIVAGEEIEI
ncbi:MAG: type II toxin-antitoxin system RelE/ParE family toxin [Planctomycetes bacterium]|nr:type II toxin-antitoxin system RelE/ParE family toxin [Planctomycetota bacterium]